MTGEVVHREIGGSDDLHGLRQGEEKMKMIHEWWWRKQIHGSRVCVVVLGAGGVVQDGIRMEIGVQTVISNQMVKIRSSAMGCTMYMWDQSNARYATGCQWQI